MQHTRRRWHGKTRDCANNSRRLRKCLNQVLRMRRSSNLGKHCYMAKAGCADTAVPSIYQGQGLRRRPHPVPSLRLRWARKYSVVVVSTRGGSAVGAGAALPGWASSAFLPLPMMDENANQNSARAASSAKRNSQTFYSPTYNATNPPTSCRPLLSPSVQSALRAHVYASAKHWCMRQMRIFGFCGLRGRKKSACCSALRT